MCSIRIQISRVEDTRDVKLLYEHGIVPILVDCLSPKYNQFAKLQIEASWCMCNILGVIDIDLKFVEDFKLIDLYSDMLTSDNIEIIDNVNILFNFHIPISKIF